MSLTLQEDPEFYCFIKVPYHAIKKNGKKIIFRKDRNRPAIISNEKVQKMEFFLSQRYTLHKVSSKREFPIRGDIYAEFVFYMQDYYTKEGTRRKTMPDISNLVQIHEDSMQENGIIENDTDICALKILRLPGNENSVEVKLYSMKGTFSVRQSGLMGRP